MFVDPLLDLLLSVESLSLSLSLILSCDQNDLPRFVQFLQRILYTYLREGHKLDKSPPEKHPPVFLSFGAELASASYLGPVLIFTEYVFPFMF